MWSLITWAMPPTVYAGFSRSRQRWSLGWRCFLGINPYQRKEKIHSELQCRFGTALATLPGVNEALGVLHGPKGLAGFTQSPDTCYHLKGVTSNGLALCRWDTDPWRPLALCTPAAGSRSCLEGGFGRCIFLCAKPTTWRKSACNRWGSGQYIDKTRAEGWKKKPKNRLESIDPIAIEVRTTLTFFCYLSQCISLFWFCYLGHVGQNFKKFCLRQWLIWNHSKW